VDAWQRNEVDGWQRNVLVRVSSINLQIKADGYSNFALGQGWYCFRCKIGHWICMRLHDQASLFDGLEAWSHGLRDKQRHDERWWQQACLIYF
jgi:hypothetical protein